DAGDDLLRLLLGLAVGGIEVGLPEDNGTVGLVVGLEPELGLVVLHRQRALPIFVGVGYVLGAGQLLLDLAAVFQRERAEGHVTLFGLLAFGDGGMPLLDGAEGADFGPNLGGQPRRLDPLLDRDRVGRAGSDHDGQAGDRGQFHYTHAFLSTG